MPALYCREPPLYSYTSLAEPRPQLHRKPLRIPTYMFPTSRMAVLVWVWLNSGPRCAWAQKTRPSCLGKKCSAQRFEPLINSILTAHVTSAPLAANGPRAIYDGPVGSTGFLRARQLPATLTLTLTITLTRRRRAPGGVTTDAPAPAPKHHTRLRARNHTKPMRNYQQSRVFPSRVARIFSPLHLRAGASIACARKRTRRTVTITMTVTLAHHQVNAQPSSHAGAPLFRQCCLRKPR